MIRHSSRETDFYQFKDGKQERAFNGLEWLGAMCSHAPNKREKIVRYYGYYSNVSRRRRKKGNQDRVIPIL
ncbi:MAG: transposase [Proteobacteria bacterium]|nr:transposase [Pseudomonadota bacterium]